MATQAQFDAYAQQLANIQSGYSGSPTQAHMDAMMLRYKALEDGVDLFSLESASSKIRTGQDLTASQWAIQTPMIKEVQYMDALLAAKRAYMANPTELNHQQAQNVRALAMSEGVDLNDMEQLSQMILLGRPLTPQERKDSDAYIAQVQALYKDNMPINENPILPPNMQRKFRFDGGYGEVFSGADMVVFIAFPGYKPLQLGTATTLSITTYREKKQVRTTGRISAKGITRSARTISGRIIFTDLNESVVESLRKEIPYLRQNKLLLMDELPAFDLIISFGNEYGQGATLLIEGCTTVDEQKTMSIEELFSESIFTYLARRYEPMRNMSANMNVPYTPSDWYSSEFRLANSEKIGMFKISDLPVYSYAANIDTYGPFINSPEQWQYVSQGSFASATTLAASPEMTALAGAPSSVTNPTAPSYGITYYVQDDAGNAVSGAIVNWDSYVGKNTLTTDSNGRAYLKAKQNDYVEASASKSGYAQSETERRTVTGDVTVTLTMTKQSHQGTGGDPSEIYMVDTTLKSGQFAQKMPPITLNNGWVNGEPSIIVKNARGLPMSGVKVYWNFDITNWDSISAWSHPSKLYGSKSGAIGTSVTDVNGIASCPNYSTADTPNTSYLQITAQPANSNNSSYADDSPGDPSLKQTWLFYLP